jgi:hypothetical protein
MLVADPFSLGHGTASVATPPKQWKQKEYGTATFPVNPSF